MAQVFLLDLERDDFWRPGPAATLDSFQTSYFRFPRVVLRLEDWKHSRASAARHPFIESGLDRLLHML